MADDEQLAILKKGVADWRTYQKRNSHQRARLGDADLSGASLANVLLSHGELVNANLERADLSHAVLVETNLRGTNLQYANLSGANLWGAILSSSVNNGTNADHANLSDAILCTADLSDANFRHATLAGADLSRAILVGTDLSGADLTGCRVYGVAAWDVRLEGTIQKNLIITRPGEPEIVVDDIEVAQFVHLLLHNQKIRSVIETVGQKGVLILGRFTPERKEVLDAMRTRLRELGFVPMMFDFERPQPRDFTETIKTLASLSRFIVADITNPKSSPLELQATMPDYMVPFVPIIQEREEPFSMFRDLRQKYGEWVMDLLTYDSAASLIEHMEDAIVAPALDLSERLRAKKSEQLRVRRVQDYRKS